jgi:photosystem II stability/assembly factor-like uncharacterized protein
MGSLPTNTLIRSVAIDPKTPQRVYAAGPAGLFRSDDSGQTWEKASNGLAGEPLAVTLNPAAPEIVFVVLLDGSVWQSTDSASTWTKLETGA